MKAHDVRYLRQCVVCRKLGDIREMVNQPTSLDAVLHTRCFVRTRGLSGVFALTKADRDLFTLADVGVKGMKKLLKMQSQP